MAKYQIPGNPGFARLAGMVTSGEWGPAHDLVNLYLGIALFADDELDPEEQRTFMQKFGRWMPSVSVEEFERIWGEVLALYKTLGSRESRYAYYLQSTINVLRSLGGDKDKLRAVVRDLVDIAGADKELHENEVTLIKAAAITFGLSADVRMNEKTGRLELMLRDAN